MSDSKNILLIILLFMILNSCHVGRYIIYNFANINDYKKFHFREIKKSDTPFSFYDEIDKRHFKSVLKRSSFKTIDKIDSLLTSSNSVAFLVIRNDSILFEWYLPKKNLKSQFTSFSMSKSFISALIGIAIDEGKIKSVNEPITNYISSFKNPGFENITIEHLLNMRTGIKYIENYYNPFGNVAVSYYGRNLDRHISRLLIKQPPDQEFEYISVSTQLLGVIIEKATSMSVSEYCESKLWGPLGMEFDASWSVDRKNGREKAFCCLNAKARDYAKFGRLFLNEGDWDGKRLVSKKWIDKSTKKTSKSKDSFYAYQWWHVGIPDENGIVSFLAQGHLGQYIYMNPKKNTIIVRLGKNRGEIKWIPFFRSLNSSL